MGDSALTNRVRAFVYSHFTERGDAPGLGDVAEALNLHEERVRVAYGELARAKVLVMEPDGETISMAMPFSASPTGFEVRSGPRRWWANCAWDALGIPAMLGIDARIRAACGDCAAPIEVKVAGSDLAGDEPLMHMAVPAARWWDDIGFT